jgi:hypothetical protein
MAKMLAARGSRASSTVFEDFELFQGGLEFGQDVLNPDCHLGTATKTLKRLCYSVFPIKAKLQENDVCSDGEYEVSNEDDDGDDYFDPTWHGLNSFDVGFSLRVLKRLRH